MPPRASTPHLSESTEKEDRLWAGFRRYPSHREGRIPFIKTATNWIEGKRLDDDCGAYWRVRDSLYDLTEWIERHPGGREWIQVTRGTDITEVFFSSHVGPMAEKLLAKYRVRDISTPRNSPYTLDEDGFYMTLRRNVHNYLKVRQSMVQLSNPSCRTFTKILLFRSHRIHILILFEDNL